MSDHQNEHARVVPLRRRGTLRRGTRSELLEAAGHVFAEKGLDRATGKEICERAGASTAAINYHFGGMVGLYIAVIEEANRRLFSVETLTTALAGKADAKLRLQALIEIAVEKLTGPVSSSWVLGVVGREFISPSPALDSLRQQQGVSKANILKSIVGELMNLPADHPAVARACITVIAPCVMLLVADRHALQHVFPHFGLGRNDAAALSRHLLKYTLAGLSAVARDVRQQQES